MAQRSLCFNSKGTFFVRNRTCLVFSTVSLGQSLKNIKFLLLSNKNKLFQVLALVWHNIWQTGNSFSMRFDDLFCLHLTQCIATDRLGLTCSAYTGKYFRQLLDFHRASQYFWKMTPSLLREGKTISLVHLRFCFQFSHLFRHYNSKGYLKTISEIFLFISQKS